MSRKLSKRDDGMSHSIRLQDAVLFSLVILLVSSIGIASALWYRNTRQAVEDEVRMIQDEIAMRIEEHIQRFVAVPHEINEANAAALRLLDLSQFDLDALHSFLLEQVRIFETVSSIYIGSPAGGLLDAGREGTGGALYVIETEGFRSGTFNKFSIDEKGTRNELLLSVPDFDARTRPWYIAAVENGGPSWSDVYILFSGQDMAIAASRPVYDDSGDLLLVLSSDIFLSQIDDFMHSLEYGKTGLGFIIDQSGYLIACSEDHPHALISEEGNSFQRVEALDDPSPLIQQTARYLQDSFGDISDIKSGLLGEFSFEGGRELVQVRPITDPYGIDWLSVLVIPEADFLGPVYSGTWTTIIFLIVSLLVAITIGFLIVKRITQPLEELSSAAHAVGAGIHVAIPHSGRIREIRDLSQSFETMEKRLNLTLRNLQEEVDERKHAQLTLEQSEAQLRLYIEKTPMAIFVANMAGQYVDANPAASLMTGYSREELLRMRVRELYAPHDLAGSLTHTEENVFSKGEATLVRKDGTDLWIQIDAVALAPNLQVSFCTDITQRRETEESLRHQQKMESLGTMASGVAHEINNPLMGMMNYAELIGSRITDPRTLDYAKNILREGERIAHITRSLLSFSQDDVAARHPDDIRDIISDSLPLVHTAMLRSHVTVETEIDNAVPEVLCSRQQIQQVIVNLLMNARDALDAKYPAYDVEKTIRIRVESLARDDKSWVRTSIEDHGAGMTKSQVSAAFDPFFTTKSRSEATGLGLAISFSIINEHGGYLDIESEEGKGTIVHIDLPAASTNSAS